MSDTHDEQARADRVGHDLKAAFAALGTADIPEADRPRWHQRLIAITNSSKHDLETAEGRLSRFWADWEAEIGPRPPATG